MNDLFASEPNTPMLPFALPDKAGYAVCFDQALQLFVIDVPDGQLLYAPDFINAAISQRSIEYFLENKHYPIAATDWANVTAEALAEIEFANIAWKQDHIKMYGKTMALPRVTSWYGDAGKAYTYSGIHSQPNPWNKGLLYFKQRIEAVCNARFNSVLLNWYRDGEDHLNWHSDDEAELGSNPCIASLSFGAERDFALKHIASGDKIILPLLHGSLLIMQGSLQHHWLHAVPKRKKVHTSRFNLTFRWIHDTAVQT